MVFGLIGCGSTSYEEHDPSLVHVDAGHDAGVLASKDAGAVIKTDAGSTAAFDAGTTSVMTDAGALDAGQLPGGGCTALNCSGCCSSGKCETGQTAASCGKNGVACTACMGTDRCGSAQACELDPTGVWLVQPTAAVLTDDAWDLTSNPDTRLTLWCPANRSMPNGSSPEVDETYTPTWTTGGCTGTAADLLSAGFGFTATEVDVHDDDVICSFKTIAVTEAELRAGRIDVPAMCGLKSLTVALKKQ